MSTRKVELANIGQEEVFPSVHQTTEASGNTNEEFAINCCGGPYGRNRLYGAMMAICCSFAFFPGVMIIFLGWIPFVVVGPVLFWLYKATRDKRVEQKKGASAFCCSFMTVSAIMVCFSAMRFYSLFFTPIVVAHGDVEVLEMLDM